MSRLRPYIELVEAFVERGLPAEEFQRRYLDAVKADQTILPDDEFVVVDGLFGDADFYEPDPALREQLAGALDEAELRRRAATALSRLRAFDTPRGASPG
jgi:Bacterial self-protective colicin-like immunity